MSCVDTKNPRPVVRQKQVYSPDVYYNNAFYLSYLCICMYLFIFVMIEQHNDQLKVSTIYGAITDKIKTTAKPGPKAQRDKGYDVN